MKQHLDFSIITASQRKKNLISNVGGASVPRYKIQIISCQGADVFLTSLLPTKEGWQDQRDHQD